jgi:uncharacterized protein YdeI (YjbR/CyaY-like superfamily)
MPDHIPFAEPQHWNDWLAQNHEAREVWVLFHKKASGVPSITWEQAVIEALAHGWIDGVKKSLNETQWLQRFTPRKPGSAWSQKNIAHAEKLIANGRMTPAGLAHVTLAKANGRWDTAYSGGKGADLPQDFLDAVAANPQAATGLNKLDTKNRYAIYYRLTTAKRPETRAKRLADYLALLEKGESLF